ncbi:MAG TPA: DUF4914 family protein [Armatimonadota bacterium]|nr:DUF4914 family protein [Armatimonadota bacterium]
MHGALAAVLETLFPATSYTVPQTRQELIELALGGHGDDQYEVAYDVPGHGRVTEAIVTRCRNGLTVNYLDAYMRRRDPDCLIVGDNGKTDKERFFTRFGTDFIPVRQQILSWLAEQELLVIPFTAGLRNLGYDALLIAPKNAAFFAAGLADLQGMLSADEITDSFSPRAIIYLAPTFRHTLCNGRQVVVHHRTDSCYEIFSLNLYPGPSAKKGVYGLLLSIGAAEGWLTVHGSTVQVVTPYDNVVTMMHEGASGSGKSEMLEYPLREHDGRLQLGENTVTGERRYVPLHQGCHLRPVTDDMALCHPTLQTNPHKLVVHDAEDAWFVRINHITRYGTDPHLEQLCIHTPEPLIFLNLQGVANSTCLLWEHTEDVPGKPCPNPRVILPRRFVPDVVNEPVEIDVRSFGVRTPVCTRDVPTYGILGLLHVLPPALAWLWRLVSPRGDDNPSVTATEGMGSEGVGSFWPFAAGRRVDFANLLLRQIQETPRTRHVLIPNQHIGAWRVGFMPQWIAREYLARRSGAKFRPDQLTSARSPLLGYALASMVVEGVQISPWFLEVQLQREVGEEGYDRGASILTQFFHQELTPYLEEADLFPLGREIITCCLDGGGVGDYERLITRL